MPFEIVSSADRFFTHSYFVSCIATLYLYTYIRTFHNITVKKVNSTYITMAGAHYIVVLNYLNRTEEIGSGIFFVPFLHDWRYTHTRLYDTPPPSGPPKLLIVFLSAYGASHIIDINVFCK